MAGVVGGIQLAYWRTGRDLFMVAASAAAAITVATTALARLFHEAGGDWAIWTLTLAVALVGQATVAVLWIRAGRANAINQRALERLREGGWA